MDPEDGLIWVYGVGDGCLQLPPHSMRYSAATWIALSDPIHVNTAMCVLEGVAS
jgi:hypothetical protein